MEGSYETSGKLWLVVVWTVTQARNNSTVYEKYRMEITVLFFLQIKDLARSYISRKDTLILVVAACNADLATTKALRMANEVDQDGDRTIGMYYMQAKS